MAIITIFRNPFSDEKEQFEFKEAIALKDAIIFNHGNSTVFINGIKRDENYILQNNDVCLIREYPGAAVAVVAFVFKIIVIGGAFIAADLITYGISGKHIWEHFVSWMKGILTPDTSDTSSLEKIPQLRGAKNQSGLGMSVPLILGKHLFTPYYCGSPYTWIDPTDGSDGENQYFIGLYMLGYSNIKVSQLQLGDLLLASNDVGVFNGFISPDGLYPYADDGTRKGYRTQIEIQQSNEVSLYTQKVIEEQLSIELYNVATEVGPSNPIRFSANNPMKIELEILFNNGLYGNSSNGDIENRSVMVRAQWRPLSSPGDDPDTGWTNFPSFHGSTSYNAVTGTSTFTRNKNKQARFVSIYEFEYSEITAVPEGVVELRMTRMNHQANDNRSADTIIWSAIRTYCFDKSKSKTELSLIPQVPLIEKTRQITCRIGFKIRAGDEIAGTISKFNMILESVARTWSGSSWTTMADAKTSGTVSNNPASAALLGLQQPSMGKEPYLDSELDMNAFGALYTFCATKGFTCNAGITADTKERDLVDQILTTCRSQLIIRDGKYAPLIDNERSYPVTVLNQQNTISATNTKTFDILPDGLKITFIDEADGYQTNEMYVMYDGKLSEDPDMVFQDIELPFITNRNHIFKQGRYILACMKLRPEVWSRKVSLEGYNIPIGSLISVQDETISVGLNEGGIITELITSGGFITGIVCDSFFEMADGLQYGIKIIQADGYSNPSVRTQQVITFIGYVNSFTFTVPIPVIDSIRPSIDDIVTFGEYSKIAIDALVVGKTPGDDQTFDLILVPYDPAIYTADSGPMPEFDSKTSKPLSMSAIIQYPPHYASIDDIGAAVEIISNGTNDSIPDTIDSVMVTARQDYLEISWPWSGAGLDNVLKRFIIQISDDTGASWWTLYSTKNGFNYYFNRNTDGYPEVSDLSSWRVRVKAENLHNKVSLDYSPSSSGQPVNTVNYGTWIPPVPTVSPYCNGREAVLNWTAGKQYGKFGYQVQICKKDTDPDEADWLKPDITLDARSSESNFTDGTAGELFVSVEQISQSLPLTGQGDNLPVDTKFWYRVRGVTAKPTTSFPAAITTGVWTAAYGVLARPTGSVDIVAKAIKEAQIDDGAVVARTLYVENMTFVDGKAGALYGDDAENYKLVLSGGVPGEPDAPGTFLLGSDGSGTVPADPSFFRRWKDSSGIWRMAIKLQSFLVDALSSTILGIFKVRNASNTVTVFEVNGATGRAELSGTMGIGGPVNKTSRLSLRENVGVSGITFTGSGINSLELIETGLTPADIEVKVDSVTDTPGGNWLLQNVGTFGNNHIVKFGTKYYTFSGVNLLSCTDGYSFYFDHKFTSYYGDETILGISACSGSLVVLTVEPHATKTVYTSSDGSSWSAGTTLGGNYCSILDGAGEFTLVRNIAGWASFKFPGYSMCSLPFTQNGQSFSLDYANSKYILVNWTTGVWYTSPDLSTIPTWTIIGTQSWTSGKNLTNSQLMTTNELHLYIQFISGIYICMTGGIIRYSYDLITWFEKSVSISLIAMLNISGVLIGYTSSGKYSSTSGIFTPFMKWRVADGTWNTAQRIAVGIQYVLTGYGIKISYSSITGMVTGDLWSFSQIAIKTLTLEDSSGSVYLNAENGVVSGNINARKLETARNINGMPFDGTADILSIFVSAEQPANTASYAIGVAIPFATIIKNYGTSLTTAGFFTVPVSGIYLITVQYLRKIDTTGDDWISISVGGVKKQIGKTRSENSSWFGEFSYLFSATANQTVFISNDVSARSYYAGGKMQILRVGGS